MKKIDELENRVETLEENSSPHFAIFCWVVGIIIVGFFGGLVFGDYYTVWTEPHYSCDNLKEMIILDSFPEFYAKVVYVDTFYMKKMKWESNSFFSEGDFRKQYIMKCVDEFRNLNQRSNK